MESRKYIGMDVHQASISSISGRHAAEIWILLCVACALGVVVPSAGPMGRGVATEYPKGPSVCPQAVRLNVSASANPGIFDLSRVFTAI
jgi:hypothetical protein